MTSSYLFTSQNKLCDITLVCGGSSQMVCLPAHKLVLSATSPFFRSLLNKVSHLAFFFLLFAYGNCSGASALMARSSRKASFISPRTYGFESRRTDSFYLLINFCTAFCSRHEPNNQRKWHWIKGTIDSRENNHG